MIKQTVAALAALPLLASGAAVAGPYVNIESNSGFTGSDYSSTTIDNHLGYESAVGEDASWYIQAGPALVLAWLKTLSPVIFLAEFVLVVEHRVQVLTTWPELPKRPRG